MAPVVGVDTDLDHGMLLSFVLDRTVEKNLTGKPGRSG
jgi:hypothetical protein